MKTCHETKIAGYKIRIEQHENGKFRVTYGLQVLDNLNYTKAAQEYGYNVFHALACEGVLDNQIED